MLDYVSQLIQALEIMGISFGELKRRLFVMPNEDGDWTSSSEESSKLLLDAHFARNQCTDEVPLGGLQKGGAAFLDLLDARPLAWVLNSFEPFKFAGSDGIIPAQFQR